MEGVASHTSDIDRWFNSEVARWRMFAGVVWTTLLTCPFLYSTIAIANINPFHPLSWIAESLLFVCRPWTWSYVLLSMLVVLLLSRQIGNKLTVVPVIHVSRWEKLVNILHPRYLFSVFIGGVMCSVITWCYVRLVAGDYNSLSTPCSDYSSGVCLNEHHLFVVLHGFYAGLLYHTNARLTGQYFTLFPIIQQSNFFQMKSSILSLVMKSVYVTLHRLRYFYILYYLLLGTAIKHFLATKLGLSQSQDDTAINSVSGLLDASLLWHTTLSGSLLHFLLSLATKLHKLYYTEWFHFPVETSVEQSKNHCLHNALACEQNSLVQYHGYQDLYLLSRHSLMRRMQLFSLTHLGGHPQNWIQVSRECLLMLQNFTEQLATYNNKIMTNGNKIKVGPEKNSLTGEIRHRNVTGEKVFNTDHKPKPPSFTQKFFADVKKYFVIAFFLAQDVEAHSRKLFSKAQLCIWAVEALSYLVCASFEEDTFGVVQKSLPQIIESILKLQEQVEKHIRLVPNISKHFDRNSDKSSDVPLCGALRITLKTAMYRIVAKFGDHIKSVPLAGEHQRCLNNFIDYKE